MPKKSKQQVNESEDCVGAGFSPKKGKKIRILAKMIVKASRKKGSQKKPIDVGGDTKPPKKQRKPASGRAKEWQQEFARIRKQYPGKVGDEFRSAIKKAGEKFKARSHKSKMSARDSQLLSD